MLKTFLQFCLRVDVLHSIPDLFGKLVVQYIAKAESTCICTGKKKDAAEKSTEVV